MLELLADPYASPVQGAPAKLQGELIGKGQAGFTFSEDVVVQDESGLMYLDYRSWLPVLGNVTFAIRRVPDLIGREVRVDGWFFRGTTPWTGLWRMDADGERTNSYVSLGGLVLGGLSIVAELAFLAYGLV